MVDLSAESFTAIEMIWKQQEITAKGGVISTIQSSGVYNTTVILMQNPACLFCSISTSWN